MQIFGIILKAFLEHLSGKFEPKPETFAKINVFDLRADPKCAQTVEHSTKTGSGEGAMHATRCVPGVLTLTKNYNLHFGSY